MKWLLYSLIASSLIALLMSVVQGKESITTAVFVAVLALNAIALGSAVIAGAIENKK